VWLGQRPFTCSGWGFEPRRWNGYLSLVTVVYYQVEFSASSWSLVQKTPTDCDVSEWNREASIMRRPWTSMGSCAMGGGVSLLLERSANPILQLLGPSRSKIMFVIILLTIYNSRYWQSVVKYFRKQTLLRCIKASISLVITATLKAGIYLNIFPRCSRASHEAGQAWLRAGLVIGPFAIISNIFIADRKCCSVLLCRSWKAGEGMTRILRAAETEGQCLMGFIGFMGFNALVLKMKVFQSKHNFII
jgi:hypothetical protein